jgi:hypothetical protein
MLNTIPNLVTAVYFSKSHDVSCESIDGCGRDGEDDGDVKVGMIMVKVVMLVMMMVMMLLMMVRRNYNPVSIKDFLYHP